MKYFTKKILTLFFDKAKKHTHMFDLYKSLQKNKGRTRDMLMILLGQLVEVNENAKNKCK